MPWHYEGLIAKGREILREKTQKMVQLLCKDLSYQIQGAFYEVYKAFGNSFKESVYHKALIEELQRRELAVDDRKRIDIYYKGKMVGSYVPDLVVDRTIVIELKCKTMLTKDDLKQFWYYLKGSEYRLGYLVNFGSIGKVEYVRRIYDSARNLSRNLA